MSTIINPEHCFSMMYAKGHTARKNYRESLEWVLEHRWNNPSSLSETKDTAHLMAMGYDHTKEVLDDRKEHLFNRMSIMMIDCDNTSKDPEIMTKFNEYLRNYDFWTYESASSNTPEKPYPRFRALIPMDSEIEWTRFNKKAIGHLFSMFVDDGASWFYEPTRSKFNTITHHTGKLFPAMVLQKYIDQLRTDHERKMREIEDRSNKMKLWRLRHPEYQPGKLDPRNLPCVKKYLEGSWNEGTDRRPRAHAAIYGMVAKDIPSDEIRDIIMSGPASQFREFLHNSFRDSCTSLNKFQRNPF